MRNKKKTHINILYVPENINYVVTLNSDECVAKNLREFKAEFAVGMKHWLVIPDGFSFNGTRQISIMNKELSKYYKRNISYSISWASRLSHVIVTHWSEITPGHHDRMTFKWEELVTEFFDISYCANPNKMN